MDAAELKLSISDTATKTIEGGIRSLVRGNKLVDVPGFSDDVIAAGAASIADIEKLMAELLVARDYLQAEGERVRRNQRQLCPLGADCVGFGQDHRRKHRQVAYPRAGCGKPGL